jgi:hypothetical protein
LPLRTFTTSSAAPETTLSYLDLVQWPAMIVTVLAAWFVASTRKGRRNAGFWLFIASNILWILWGFHTSAYALIVLQVCLAVLNIRGARKTEMPTRGASSN